MKKFLKLLYANTGKIWQSFISLLCVLIFSKFFNGKFKSLRQKCSGSNNRLLILCNGPSMGASVKANVSYYQTNPILVVNNYYNSELLVSLRPQYHIICDPAYFRKGVKYANQKEIDKFADFLNRIDWDITMFVPYDFKDCPLHKKISNSHVNVCFINFTPVDGIDSISHWLYKNNLGMPIAMNILIPAVFSAINLGYKNIEIYGADYSWPKDVRVNKLNQTCMKHSHFYDEEDELRVMKGFDMAKLFGNFSKAFNCHKMLRRYAESVGANIINCTPGSFIDAYNRKEGC